MKLAHRDDAYERNQETVKYIRGVKKIDIELPDSSDVSKLPRPSLEMRASALEAL